MDVEALIRLANAPDTARQPPQSQMLLEVSLRQCGQPEQAFAVLERACEIHPGDFWIHFDLGGFNYNARPARLEAAVRHCMVARALRPQSAAIWVKLGSVLTAQGKLDEAVAAHRKALELDPNDAGAHNNLGNTLSAKQDVDAAITHYRKAIELDPRFAGAHTNLGIALREQKKLDEAIDCHRKAIELDPTFAAAHNNLGFVLRQQNKVDEAVAAYRKAIELDPTFAKAYLNLGHALGLQNKVDEALVAFRKAIELAPKDALGHYNVGVALSVQGKLDEAIAAYQEALRLKPDSSLAQEKLNNVAWNFVAGPDPEARDPRRAAELVKQVIAQNANPEFLAGSAPMLLLADDTDTYRRLCARVIGKLGDTKEPRTAYLVARIGALAPDAAPDPTRLVEIAERAVRAQPVPHHLHTLGLAHYRAGQFDEAIRQLHRSVEGNWSANAANWLVLAMAHQRLGRADEARQWFDKAVRWIENAGPEAPRDSVGALRSLHRHDSLACMVLRREAETLLGLRPGPAPEGKKAPGENK
jgi:tetratricopeptide (TPR) repeat protein